MTEPTFIETKGGMMRQDIQRLVDDHARTYVTLMAEQKKEFTEELGKTRADVNLLSKEVRGNSDTLCTLVGDVKRGLPGMIPEQGEKIDRLLDSFDRADEKSNEWNRQNVEWRTEVIDRLVKVEDNQGILKASTQNLENKVSDLETKFSYVDWLLATISFTAKAATSIKERSAVLMATFFTVASVLGWQTLAPAGASSVLSRFKHDHPYLALVGTVIFVLLGTVATSSKKPEKKEPAE